METFTTDRAFIDNPRFEARRIKSLQALDLDAIDAPIVDIIGMLSQFPDCYTLQSCWGHFVHEEQTDPHGLEPLARYSEATTVKYRIAYLAICIENSDAGKRLHTSLRDVARIDPQYIQFGCADWFWLEHVNSYVLQTEPERFKLQDTAMVSIAEALHLQSVKDSMFQAIRNICLQHTNSKKP